MAKKQTIIVVNAKENDPKSVVMTAEQESAFRLTINGLSEKIEKDLKKEQEKEVALAKLVSLGLTEADIRAVMRNG